MSDLQFEIVGASVEPYAATPAIGLRLRITERSGTAIDTIALRALVQIEPRKRAYAPGEERKLFELFGEPARWGDTLVPILWTQAAIMVPPFTGEAEVEIPIACSYDFEVASGKYLDALEGGDIPLRLLFSGMTFAKRPEGFSAEMVPWDLECAYRLPAALWREAMDSFFPNQKWIRIDRATFDALYRFRMRRGLISWEQTLDRLLDDAEERV